MKKYLIAHDLGTSSNKASLFSTDGQLINSCTVPYAVDFFGTHCAQQNPEDWWNAVCKATKEIVKGISPKDILAMSFSSQMQACVVVDKKGHHLRPAMIWADLRAKAQEEQLIKKIGADRMYLLTGHRPSASYSLEKLMWIRDNEPQIYDKTYKMLLAKDYIICRLTGEFVTDYSEASGTDAFDLKKSEWSLELLNAAQINPAIMPELHASTDVIGNLKKEAAILLGLNEETAIVCGGGDGPCSALGAGSIRDGEMFLSLGTSAWIAGTSDEMFLDKDQKLICFGHVLPGKYMPCGTMQAAGSSYSYMRKLFYADKEQTQYGKSVYEEMNELALSSPPGANGLIFLPYLLGERSPRWNPSTSGGFLGIRMEHKKSDYLRAVLEGIAMNLNIILQAHTERIPISELTLTGGGAKGDASATILADVLGVTLHRLENVETATSVAAAVIAGVGVGAFKDFTVIDKFIKRKDDFYPTESLKEVYGKQQQLFETGYQCLCQYYEADELARKSDRKV